MKISYTKINQYEMYLRFIIFFTLFCIGFNIFSDYGVSLDEDAYIYNGLIEYNFLRNFFYSESFNFVNEYNNYINNTEKLSNLFYLLVFFIRDISFLNIHQISHMLNFCIFLLSCYFFYLLIYKRFSSKLLAYLAIVIILTTPRIFAESFYNARDLFYMSFLVINIYLFNRLLENFNIRNIIFFSFISAICLNLRIFSLIFFILSLFILILEFESSKKVKVLVFNIFLVFFLTFLIFFVITPYYWNDPVINFFKYYFSDLSTTNEIRITNIFLGDLYSSQNSPWYYFIIWIVFTVPVIYIFLFFLGFLKSLIYYLMKLINLKENTNIWSSKNELIDFYIVFSFILTFFLITRFGKINVDGWRHLYFLYPLIIYCIFIFLDSLKKFKNIYLSIIFILFTQALLSSIWIYRNHPYQYVYFNFLETINEKINFDLDYWGISNYNIYKYILSKENDDQITIGTVSFNDLNDNYNILDEKDRSRIKITNYENSPTYLIDNYRIPYKIEKIDNARKHLSNYKKVHEVIVDKNIISTLYKIK